MSYNIPVETKTYIQKSFLPRTITQWNYLPELVVTSSSLDTFKEGVSPGHLQGRCLWYHPLIPVLVLSFTNCTHPTINFPLFFAHLHSTNRTHTPSQLALQKGKARIWKKKEEEASWEPWPEDHFRSSHLLLISVRLSIPVSYQIRPCVGEEVTSLDPVSCLGLVQ